MAWFGLESGVILARPFLYQKEQSWFRSELTTYPCISYPVMVRTWELFLSSVAPCYLVSVSKAYFVQFETETQRRSPCNSRFSDILGCDHLCLLSPICSSLSHHTIHLQQGSCLSYQEGLQGTDKSPMHGSPVITIRIVGLTGRAVVFIQTWLQSTVEINGSHGISGDSPRNFLMCLEKSTFKTQGPCLLSEVDFLGLAETNPALSL